MCAIRRYIVGTYNGYREYSIRRRNSIEGTCVPSKLIYAVQKILSDFISYQFTDDIRCLSMSVLECVKVAFWVCRANFEDLSTILIIDDSSAFCDGTRLTKFEPNRWSIFVFLKRRKENVSTREMISNGVILYLGHYNNRCARTNHELNFVPRGRSRFCILLPTNKLQISTRFVGVIESPNNYKETLVQILWAS